MLLASEEEALVGAWFEGQRFFGSGLLSSVSAFHGDTPPLLAACRWLDAYFSGDFHALPPLPPLAPVGSPFRRAVWQMLRDIPLGQTSTYGQLTATLRRRGVKASPQAVGGAVGHNPLSLFLPCHRVLGARGSLTGYAAGLERKLRLLTHEGVTLY